MAALRNIGILAHVDAGKTTLTERFLFYAGVVWRMGEVEDGTAVMDWMAQEQARGITITAAATRLAWRGTHINLLDTPGHVDFAAEVQRCLRVLDGVIVVVSGVEGVQAQTEAVWRQADAAGLPRLVFVNKLDRAGADAERAVADLERRFSVRALPLQVPWFENGAFVGIVDAIGLRALRFDRDPDGARPEVHPPPPELEIEIAIARERILEVAGEMDDGVLEDWLAGREPDPEAVLRALRRATLARTCVPVLFGAARRNRAVQPLLDAVVDLLPAPGERHPLRSEGPATVIVFKRMIIPGVGDTAWLRVLAGRLDRGDTLVNAATGQRHAVTDLLRMHSNAAEDIESAGAGDIVAALDLHARTGDILGEADGALSSPMVFPEPVMSQAVELESAAELPRLEDLLTRLVLEDPTLRFAVADDGRVVLSGLGELHLEIVRDRLEEAGLSVRLGRPAVQLRARPGASAEGQAEVEGAWALVRLGPARGCSLEGEVGDRVAAREALLTALEGNVEDVEATVQARGEGEPRAEAVRRAVAAALAASKPEVLEPWMRMEIRAPRELLGSVLNEVSAHEGAVIGVDEVDGVAVVVAAAPLRALFGYASELRSRTSGRGDLSLELLEYRPTAGRPPEKR